MCELTHQANLDARRGVNLGLAPLIAALALSLPGFAGEAPLQPPYGWRGINGSGVFPAQANK